MNEVLKTNFKTLYPKLEIAVNNATFIAIDAEFTGLYSEEKLKHSFFDSFNDRYKLLKKNIQQFMIIQFGIATFRHVPYENTYKVDCFNFYLFPKSIPLKNRHLIWQVAALEFLCKHNFEFNKFLKEGISFLDETDEKLLKNYIKEDSLAYNLNHLTYEEENEFINYKTKISEWIANKSGETLKVETSNPILQYLIHKDIRHNYKNVWSISDDKSVNIIEISPNMHEFIKENDKETLEKELLDYYIGFSIVFKLLASSKKIIVGHNILLDLMFMHQQFYKPLPNSYNEFKKNIHELFPQIYDTKFLSYEVRKLFSKEEVSWKISSLSTLYEYFTTKGKLLTLNSPKIAMNNEESSNSDIILDEKKYHTAGWDAYFAGYIYIKMAHIFCVNKFGIGLEERIATHAELISSIKNFVNCINITRGNEMYMKFDGPDPMLSRPEWLHVKLKSPSVDIKQLMEKFSSFGQVDVMPFAQRRVLVAVANHKSALHILRHFNTSEEFQVARYSRIRHATPISICLWSGVILSGSLFAWMLKKCF